MKILPTLLVFVTVQSAFAWGPTGHKIVAQIADDQLTARTKQKVSELLQGQTMAEVSNWADSVKNTPAWVKSKPWHYVDIPDGHTYEDITHDPEGDAITAITQMVNILKSSSSTTSEKATALKFIIHFVGDIHQPLHIGRPSDRGGNSIKVRYEGRLMNLHSLWDSSMISNQQLDYVQYAHYLQTQHFMKTSYDLPGISFSQIINEAMVARETIYQFGFHPDETVVLDATYLKANQATMNSGLLMGGKRLSGLLNSIF